MREKKRIEKGKSEKLRKKEIDYFMESSITQNKKNKAYRQTETTTYRVALLLIKDKYYRTYYACKKKIARIFSLQFSH